jgi:hypothetical protein
LILGSLMLKLLFLLWNPANREGPQLPEQSKASWRLVHAGPQRDHMHGSGVHRGHTQPVPGNLEFRQCSSEHSEQRLTRVGENSACKLHAILQKKIPVSAESAGGNLVSEITTSSWSVSSLPV